MSDVSPSLLCYLFLGRFEETVHLKINLTCVHFTSFLSDLETPRGFFVTLLKIFIDATEKKTMFVYFRKKTREQKL